MMIGGEGVSISVSWREVVEELDTVHDTEKRHCSATTCAVDKLRRPLEAQEDCLSADVHRASIRRTAPEQRQFERD